MNTHFADWYRAARIPPDSDALPKRWKAIEAFETGASNIISLARLFYGLGMPENEFLSTFRASFQEEDAAFPMQKNDQELVVLAGAKLVHVIEDGSTDEADFAALCLVSAAAQNLRAPPAVTEIPEIAANYLRDRSLKRSVAPRTFNSFSAMVKLPPPQDAFAREYQALVKDFQLYESELAMVAEESNILWWLFSEHSRDRRIKWSTVTPAAAALMAGKELADLTRLIPGSNSAAAILDRVIRFSDPKPPKSVSVRDAINDVSVAWRQDYQEGGCPVELESLMPISRIVKLSLTAPRKNQWVPVAEKDTGTSATSRIAPHILAYQLFLEALLCRTWKVVAR